MIKLWLSHFKWVTSSGTLYNSRAAFVNTGLCIDEWDYIILTN